jgi:hypothetical protein
MAPGDDATIALSFFVADDNPAPSREGVQAVLQEAASSIAWVLGPPELVDEREVIEAQPAESPEAFERRRHVSTIISEGARNIVWPLGAPFSPVAQELERRPHSPAIERRLLGGRVLLHDPRRSAECVPLDVDRREYLSIAELVARLAAYARTQGCTWNVALAGEEIGQITPAGPDDGISEGLLAEWERTLLEREGR